MRPNYIQCSAKAEGITITFKDTLSGTVVRGAFYFGLSFCEEKLARGTRVLLAEACCGSLAVEESNPFCALFNTRAEVVHLHVYQSR